MGERACSEVSTFGEREKKRESERKVVKYDQKRMENKKRHRPRQKNKESDKRETQRQRQWEQIHVTAPVG